MVKGRVSLRAHMVGFVVGLWRGGEAQVGDPVGVWEGGDSGMLR